MDYVQLKTAIGRFGEMLEAFRENDRRPALEQEAVQDSLIKRFEYTLEVAWKTCKRHLQEEGFTEAATGSPKSIMRLAAQRELIDNPEQWFGYLRFRQDVLYNCSREIMKPIFDISEDFYEDATRFLKAMTDKRKMKI
ncbi:MAG: nucleotidyltransferase substrate binding protein [Phycisphaerae bacterium]|nr:nucleotidyltransferase substrate binding protein [Phycisphaerae bacterium]